jgi:hypothetical protein
MPVVFLVWLSEWDGLTLKGAGTRSRRHNDIVRIYGYWLDVYWVHGWRRCEI